MTRSYHVFPCLYFLVWQQCASAISQQFVKLSGFTVYVCHSRSITVCVLQQHYFASLVDDLQRPQRSLFQAFVELHISNGGRVWNCLRTQR